MIIQRTVHLVYRRDNGIVPPLHKYHSAWLSVTKANYIRSKLNKKYGRTSLSGHVRIVECDYVCLSYDLYVRADATLTQQLVDEDIKMQLKQIDFANGLHNDEDATTVSQWLIDAQLNSTEG